MSRSIRSQAASHSETDSTGLQEAALRSAQRALTIYPPCLPLVTVTESSMPSRSFPCPSNTITHFSLWELSRSM